MNTEVAGLLLQAVGERRMVRYELYRKEQSRGLSGDYAGMSNDKTGENPVRRKPKVSSAR